MCPADPRPPAAAGAAPVRRDGDAVQLQVRDDGIGIAPEHLPRIWDRFYQVSASRSAESSGLGLSMVKWIVEAHHGEIRVESKEGAGTTFTARLPARFAGGGTEHERRDDDADS